MKRTQKYLAITLAALFVCPPLSVQSAEGTKRVLLVSSQPEQAISNSAMDELGANIDLVNLRADKTPAGLSLDRQFRNGHRLFQKAKRAYEEIEFEKALNYLKKARKYANADTLKEIFFMEGVIYQSLQQNKNSIRSLQAYALFRGRSPDSAIYAPELIGLYKQARRKLKKRPRVPLSISPVTSISHPAHIKINGRSGGTMQNVRPGYYFVQVDQLGSRPFAELVYVRSKGKRMTVGLRAFTPTQLVAAIRQENHGSNRASLLRLLEQKTQTDGLLFIENLKAELFVGGDRVWGRPFTGDAQLTASDGNHVREAILPNMDSLKESSSMIASLAHTPNPAGQEMTLESSSTSWYQTWWFWTLVGTAAAAGAGGAFIMMNQGSSPSDTIQLSVQGQ